MANKGQIANEFVMLFGRAGNAGKRIHITYDLAITAAIGQGSVSIATGDGVFRLQVSRKSEKVECCIYKNSRKVAAWKESAYEPSVERWEGVIGEINRNLAETLNSLDLFPAIRGMYRAGYTDTEVEAITLLVGVCALKFLPQAVEETRYSHHVFWENGVILLTFCYTPVVLLCTTPQGTSWIVDLPGMLAFTSNLSRWGILEQCKQFILGRANEVFSEEVIRRMGQK